jgi:TonB family protein
VAVFTGDESDRSFGAFVLVSLILHAMLFFVFPRWEAALGTGLFAGPGGGIISVVPIEIQQPAPRAQVARQQPQPQPQQRSASEETTPPKQEPEPAPVETAKAEVSQPEPEPTPTPQDDVRAPDTRVVPEPEPEPVVNDHALQQPDSNGDHVLTSEHGQDVVMAGGSSTDAAGQAASSLSETEPDEEPAEPAPPPLPPLPAASSIVAGGGRIQYPKNAINEGLAGTVKVEAYVPKGSTSANRIEIIQSSGASSLDQVARLTIQNGWRMEPMLEDYILTVTVSFSGPPEFHVSIHYDGVRYVRDE